MKDRSQEGSTSVLVRTRKVLGLMGMVAILVALPAPLAAANNNKVSKPPKSTTTTTAAPTTTTTAAALTSAAATSPVTSASKVGTTVGSAQYPVPSGSIVVAPNGSDSASGTAGAPLLTIGRAIRVAASGSTIVLRAGSYHESVTIPETKRLTIQSWPGEAVWLDGSVVVTGWVRDGASWRYDGWVHEFDASPTFTRGAEDNTEKHWGFVSADHPMAAHPDQVWIGGVAQRQVASLAEVTAGSFFHDRANDSLHLGSDPTGRTVRASALQRAIRVARSHNSVVRGIGVRRYAPSVPDFGAVLVDNANGVVLEHLAVIDGATTGLAVVGGNATVRNVYLARHGMIGMRGTYADGLVLDRVLSEDNNVERFNTAPVAGGTKISRSRHVTVRDSILRRNHGTGLWIDESVYDVIITGNELGDNSRNGAALEISALALFSDNVVTGNGSWGLKINNTDRTRVWNNTFDGNNGSIWVVQDARRPATSPGRDPRQPFPDPTMTWVITSARISNNVLANQVGAQPCMLCVQDAERLRTAEQMGVSTNHNVYNRPNSTAPSRLVTWSRGASTPGHYTTLTAFRTGTAQEGVGHHIDGAAVVTTTGDPTSAMPSSATAHPLPADVASLVGVASGTRRHGAFPVEISTK
jgi:trimeric autotransporter adhesin